MDTPINFRCVSCANRKYEYDTNSEDSLISIKNQFHVKEIAKNFCHQCENFVCRNCIIFCQCGSLKWCIECRQNHLCECCEDNNDDINLGCDICDEKDDEYISKCSNCSYSVCSTCYSRCTGCGFDLCSECMGTDICAKCMIPENEEENRDKYCDECVLELLCNSCRELQKIIGY